MKSKRNIIISVAVITIALLFAGAGVSMAGDLDDGISKFTDDPISKDDELGQKDINTKFIILKAKAKASKGGDGSGGGNMNSVVSYGDIKGDVTIIDLSKGDKTQVVGN